MHEPSGEPRPLSTTKKLLYTTLVLVITFGTPELLLRALWRPAVPEIPPVMERRFVTWLSSLSEGPNRNEELYRVDPELIWSLRPNASIDSINRHHGPGGEQQPVRITINPAGYRGAPAPSHKSAPSELRVLCMGDSNFFGYPLDDRQVFPQALRDTLTRRLPAGASITVINGGVPGYSSLQGRRLYERQFATLEYDWLLLSYLNNDAWTQPHADRELLTPAAARSRRFTAWSDHLALVRWGRSLLPRATTAEKDLVPRVSLPEYLETYRFFIASAAARGARVLIIDYRAYDEYRAYSEALRDFAARSGVIYFPVRERLQEYYAQRAQRAPPAPYADRADAVVRRWGAQTLREKPQLWIYAEYFPEHLNEIGVAWLVDQVAPILGSEHR